VIDCPVCAHPLGRKPYAVWPPPSDVELRPPYYKQLGNPSYMVCPRCGYEFGQDDNPWADEVGISFAEHRVEWEASGKPWLSEKARAQFEGRLAQGGT